VAAGCHGALAVVFMGAALPTNVGQECAMSGLIPAILLIISFLLVMFALRFAARRRWR
jgi:hypothetical protein